MIKRNPVADLPTPRLVNWIGILKNQTELNLIGSNLIELELD